MLDPASVAPAGCIGRCNALNELVNGKPSRLGTLLAQCCRVPVAVGHFMNVWLTLGKKAELGAIEEALRDTAAAPYLKVSGGPVGEGVTALDCVHHRDQALVGRLRLDPRDAEQRTVCLTIAGDNLRLGAATNAVRIASRWFPSADPALQAPGNTP